MQYIIRLSSGCVHALPIGLKSGLICFFFIPNHGCFCVVYYRTIGKVEILILFWPLVLCLVLCSQNRCWSWQSKGKTWYNEGIPRSSKITWRNDFFNCRGEFDLLTHAHTNKHISKHPWLDTNNIWQFWCEFANFFIYIYIYIYR